MFIAVSVSSSVCPATPDRPETKRTEMKTIGLISGISWTSSIEYYRMMNELVMKRLGGLHSAKIIMYSVEFGEFSRRERLADKGDWKPLIDIMVDAARRLEIAGADFIVICSNTMHSAVDDIKANVKIPVIHIRDLTIKKVKERGITTVAVLGTKYTMENLYNDTDELYEKYGVKVVVPNPSERIYINNVIFDELCANKITSDSREGYKKIINRLIKEDGGPGRGLGLYGDTAFDKTE